MHHAYVYIDIHPSLFYQRGKPQHNIIIIFLSPVLTVMLLKSHHQFPLGAIFLLSNVALAARDRLCPPLGPVLPAPISPSTHDSVQAAIQNATDRFRDLTASFNTTGISVAVRSIHEASPMLELHHTPAVRDNTSTSTVDSDTIYRIGSISKIFAVLSVLTQGQMKLEDPIVKYVPELLRLRDHAVPVANDITAVNWDEVTVGSLASHMSGIGTDRMLHAYTPASSIFFLFLSFFLSCFSFFLSFFLSLPLSPPPLL